MNTIRNPIQDSESARDVFLSSSSEINSSFPILGDPSRTTARTALAYNRASRLSARRSPPESITEASTLRIATSRVCSRASRREGEWDRDMRIPPCSQARHRVSGIWTPRFACKKMRAKYSQSCSANNLSFQKPACRISCARNTGIIVCENFSAILAGLGVPLRSAPSKGRCAPVSSSRIAMLQLTRSTSASSSITETAVDNLFASRRSSESKNWT